MIIEEKKESSMFQHTATRRWLRITQIKNLVNDYVSTHSHPKVAAGLILLYWRLKNVSTHSHPKVAALCDSGAYEFSQVSTHSHPKVAAVWANVRPLSGRVSTHSHPKVAAFFFAPFIAI